MHARKNRSDLFACLNLATLLLTRATIARYKIYNTVPAVLQLSKVYLPVSDNTLREDGNHFWSSVYNVVCSS